MYFPPIKIKSPYFIKIFCKYMINLYNIYKNILLNKS